MVGGPALRDTGTTMISRAAPDGSWAYHERAPHPWLRPFVRRDYLGFVERLGDVGVARLEVPVVGVPIVINLGDPIEVDGAVRRDSFVAGPADRPSVVRQAGRSEGVQIDLSPLGARVLLGLPLGEISRQVVSAEELLAPMLAERLADRSRWAARFALVDEVLLGRLADAGGAVAVRPDLARAWHRLAAAHGGLDIGTLATELSCSRRHLSGRFRAELGLAPKTLARLLRFRRTLELLDAGGALADVAAAAGYSDQPHLNRDFRAFADCTPREYLARRLETVAGVAAA